jgi:hypothetical protein
MCIPGTRLPNSHDRSTQSCVAGCSTTGRSPIACCIHSCSASTPTWCVGCEGNIDGNGHSRKPKPAGSATSVSSRGCSPIGRGWLHSGDQDDKSRMSREAHVRDPWEPGAEMPPATRHVKAGPLGYPARSHCSRLCGAEGLQRETLGASHRALGAQRQEWTPSGGLVRGCGLAPDVVEDLSGGHLA